MKIYTVKEASTKTSIPVRTIQHFCKRDNVRKKLNVYQITDVVLEGWIVSNAKKPRKLKVARAIAQDVALSVADIQKLNLDEIEDFEFKFRREGEFPKEGNFVFVPKDFVYAEYTEFEYKDAEDKLKEWQYQKQLLLDQQKTFDNLIKTQKEQTLFYKNQVKYYQKLADRTLTMHEKLLETIQTQTKDHFIDTTIRAKKTDWSKKDKK
jgi:lipopolysaccharide export LptBFGC system permease protein LptF